HARLAQSVVQRLQPDVVGMPTGHCPLYNHVLSDRQLHRHAMANFRTESELLKSERETLEHCMQMDGLAEVLSRRLLMRARQEDVQRVPVGAVKPTAATTVLAFVVARKHASEETWSCVEKDPRTALTRLCRRAVRAALKMDIRVRDDTMWG
ncbi:hypothetical protein DIPPA_13746, partial [Diplonema papillatum]